MTRYLFWQDSYMRDFEATVTEKNEKELLLDQTCFYPSGGGQPSDTGTINGIRVNDVIKLDSGEIVHILENTAGIEKGMTVNGNIDWGRRYRLMRLHSACHVVSGVMAKSFGVRKHTGIQISEESARMGFDMQKLDSDVSESIESEVNKVISEGHSIVAEMLTWAQVNSDPALKTVTEERYEKIDVPRVLDIVGLDRQLDGGTHVRNTLEIGRIKIIRHENKGKSDKRVTFVLENP